MIDDNLAEFYDTINRIEQIQRQNRRDLVAFDIKFNSDLQQIIFCDTFFLALNQMADGECRKRLRQTIEFAFRRPGHTIKTTANMTQFKCRIKAIPKPLKDLFFQTTKHTIKITPEITMGMLEDAELNYDDIVREIIQKHPIYIWHRNEEDKGGKNTLLA